MAQAKVSFATLVAAHKDYGSDRITRAELDKKIEGFTASSTDKKKAKTEVEWLIQHNIPIWHKYQNDKPAPARKK